MPSLQGGCLCGDIRYSASGEPKITSICHCKDCQKQSGSAFVEVVAGPNEAFSISGTASSFTNAGNSGHKLTRHFCPSCGSMLTIEAEGFPSVTLIMGGTLDDTSWFKPTVQLFCDSMQPWVTVSQDIKSFVRMPT